VSSRIRNKVGCVPDTIGGGAYGLASAMFTGDEDVGKLEGKMLDDAGGYEEYVRGARIPGRCGETNVVLNEFRTLAPDSSLQKCAGRTSENSWSGKATLSVAMRR